MAAAADHAGQRVNDRVQEYLHLFGGGGHGMDMEPVLPGDAVDLRDGIAPAQELRDLRQAVGRCLDLEIAGHRPADLPGIDNGGVFLNNALLLQGLYPGLYRNSGQADLIGDIRIGNARVFYQQLHNLLIQPVQSVQIHIASSPGHALP